MISAAVLLASFVASYILGFNSLLCHTGSQIQACQRWQTYVIFDKTQFYKKILNHSINPVLETRTGAEEYLIGICPQQGNKVEFLLLETPRIYLEQFISWEAKIILSSVIKQKLNLIEYKKKSKLIRRLIQSL